MPRKPAPTVVPFPRQPGAGERPAYEADFHAWAVEQAALLRAAAAAGGDPRGVPHEATSLDYANLAEELEGLANRDRRELRSRLGTIVEHLVKLEFSPATEPVPNWKNTVERERDEIDGILKDSPSLRGRVPDLLAKAAPWAVERALRELVAEGEREAAKQAAKVARAFVSGCHYADEQVLQRKWWPERQAAAPSRPRPDPERARGRAPRRGGA
jgi:hypothetical protein